MTPKGGHPTTGGCASSNSLSSSWAGRHKQETALLKNSPRETATRVRNSTVRETATRGTKQHTTGDCNPFNNSLDPYSQPRTRVVGCSCDLGTVSGHPTKEAVACR